MPKFNTQGNKAMAHPDKDKVYIFDTTLRDGEQAPGFSMSNSQKLRMAHKLSDLGVDIIEAGFARASQGDFDSIQNIAKEVKGSTICSLSRCNQGDIEASGRALEKSENSRIHVFIATSPIHREFKLQMSKDEIVERAVAGIKQALNYTDNVEFSAEDAIRTERDYLADVLSAAIEAGARTVNIPDTVGYTTPDEIKDLFTWLIANVKNADQAIFSSHCHNDLGLAVANSLAAVQAGGRQIECTMNGIGERAGNASLEEVVMAMRVRGSEFGVHTDIDTTKIYPASRLLSSITGQPVARNKAIVGDNAFAHESGIHQHGMLANPETYEIMKPEDVGIVKSSLVLGKHSGRHAFVDKIKTLGLTIDSDKIDPVFTEFKALADKKKEIHDADIEALVLGKSKSELGPWTLQSMEAHSGNSTQFIPNAYITLTHADGRTISQHAAGDGPVNAAFDAVKTITGKKDVILEEFKIRAASGGDDAQGTSTVHIRHNGSIYQGQGVSTDVVVSAVEAFIEAINQIERTEVSNEQDTRVHAQAAPKGI